MHFGDICTSGIFCGSGAPGTGQNRNLADFASNAVDPSNGCAGLAIPGDPYNRPDLPGGSNNNSSSAYVSLEQDNGSCLTIRNAGQPAGAVAASPGSGGSHSGVPTIGAGGRILGCLDRIVPRSSFRGRRRVSRLGLVLHGVSGDRGCGRHGAGRVALIRVALALAVGKKCRFVRSGGRYGPLVSCLRSTYLNARGTTRFTFTFHHRLRPGTYKAWSRAIDAAGNVERKDRRRNLIRLTVP
jgi:hypothetical protein